MRGTRHRQMRRKGVTLVEMIVSAALLAVFLVVLTGLLVPFTRVFYRMQSLNHAQLVADTVMDTLRREVGNAHGYIRLYPEGETFTGTVPAGDKGAAVEFCNAEGYIELVSAEGCESTVLRKRNGALLGTQEAVGQGEVLQRYFLVAQSGTNSGDMQYTYKEADGQYVARAVTTSYGHKFYSGNTVKLEFKLGAPDAKGRVSEVVATVRVISAAGEERYAQTAALDTVERPLLRTDRTAFLP